MGEEDGIEEDGEEDEEVRADDEVPVQRVHADVVGGEAVVLATGFRLLAAYRINENGRLTTRLDADDPPDLEL